MKVLITGSSGYIGTATSWLALNQGYTVFGVDRRAPRFTWSNFNHFTIDLQDSVAPTALVQQIQPDAVIHLAASIEVAESVQNPLQYYQNNVVTTLNLLHAMNQANVKKLIFSSSAAVYGQPTTEQALQETNPLQPISPYGKSKLMVEQMLPDFFKAYGISSVALRYFNVYGEVQTPYGLIDEQHDPESHLVPLATQKILAGQPVNVFGTNFPTADGTAVRDFVHVQDVATANLKALQFLQNNEGAHIFNICSGIGTSVLQLLNQLSAQLHKPLQIATLPSRPGDPAILKGNNALATKFLNWQPTHCMI